MTSWRFDYRPTADLPPLAWLARVEGEHVDVDCGLAVRRDAGGFFEGSWAGPAELAALPAATTVFGTGLVADGASLVAITPSHNLEGIYSVAGEGGLSISNSLVALLTAEGLALDPAVDYPSLFARTRRGVGANPIEIGTAGRSVQMTFFENLEIRAGGAPALRRKLREAAFTSYADYRDRLRAALASIIVNGAPHEPVVPLSSGYDSTAVAALAAEVGCRRAIGFHTAKDFTAAGREDEDSGSEAARRLGLAMTMADRLAYRTSTGLPEAEFLASGMTGEEVVFCAFEEELRGSLMLAATWPAWIWYRTAPPQAELERDDMSGASMTEFRLRVDSVYVPLPFFGASAQRSLNAVAQQPDMRRYHVGGNYDRPIPRRLAEEAGLPRGSFARRKLGVSATLHNRPAEAFAPVTLAAIDAFAAAHGEVFDARPRPRTRRVHRALLRGAAKLRLRHLEAALQRRRQARTHFDGPTGNLLLRWAVSVVAPRYAALRQSGSSARKASAIGG